MSYLQLLPLDLDTKISNYVHHVNVKLKLFDIRDEYYDMKQKAYHFKLYIDYGCLHLCFNLGYLFESDRLETREAFIRGIEKGFAVFMRFHTSLDFLDLIHGNDKYIIRGRCDDISITKRIYDMIIKEYLEMLNTELTSLKL